MYSDLSKYRLSINTDTQYDNTNMIILKDVVRNPQVPIVPGRWVGKSCTASSVVPVMLCNGLRNDLESVGGEYTFIQLTSTKDRRIHTLESTEGEEGVYSGGDNTEGKYWKTIKTYSISVH